MWIPAVVALAFLASSGVAMLKLTQDTKDAVLVNLRNTCYNSEKLRNREEVTQTCWKEYQALGGTVP